MNSFDRIINRYETNSVKWDLLKRCGDKFLPETIPLWVADMDFAAPESVLNAVKNRTDEMIFGYTLFGDDKYFKTVTDWMKNRFNWDINSEDIFFSPGIVPALACLIRALTKEGDGVIIQQPVYYPFMRTISKNKRNIINNPLIEKEGYYSMDFEDLEKKASDPDTTMMILCSPHNPVGRVWKKEELLKVGRICLENNITLVSDEIHADLVRKTGLDYTPEHIPADSLFSETSDRIITCTAPSKTFNLAGFNHANIIIRNKELKEKWEYEFMEVSNFPGVNPISLAAAQAAYSDGEEWLDKLLKYIDTNMLMIKKFVDENLSDAEFNIPEGTYLAWLDLRKYNLDDNELEELLLKKAKVYLNQGYIFGTEGSGFVRINAACPASLLKDSLERIADALHHV